MAKQGEGGSPKYYATPAMKFRVTWSTSLVDDVNYYVRISVDKGSGYEVVGTTTTSATQFDWTYEEQVAGGAWYPQSNAFTFKVETILRSTGVSLNNTTDTVASFSYGQCNSDL